MAEKSGCGGSGKICREEGSVVGVTVSYIKDSAECRQAEYHSALKQLEFRLSLDLGDIAVHLFMAPCRHRRWAGLLDQDIPLASLSGLFDRPRDIC